MLPLPDRAALFFARPGYESQPTANASHVVVCAEEAGGTYALMPVLRELHARAIGTTVLAAGNGVRILRESGHKHGLWLDGPLDDWPEAALRPGALLITPSEDGRLEQDLLSRFASTPTVVLEDYYESGRRSVECAAETGLSLPTVCVVDQEAERLVRRRFPGLSVPVKVTGSPMFDALAGEDVAAVQARNKDKLGVPSDKNLVTFFIPRLGQTSLRLAVQVADAFRQMGDEYLFAPRRHPADRNERAAYERLFDGLPLLDTIGILTDTVADAADVVIAQRSLTVLRAAVRRQRTVTLTVGLAPGFTFPAVDAGISLPARPVELPELLPELLQGTSLRCMALDQNMRRLKADGRAAARVADIVCTSFSM